VQRNQAQHGHNQHAHGHAWGGNHGTFWHHNTIALSKITPHLVSLTFKFHYSLNASVPRRTFNNDFHKYMYINYFIKTCIKIHPTVKFLLKKMVIFIHSCLIIIGDGDVDDNGDDDDNDDEERIVKRWKQATLLLLSSHHFATFQLLFLSHAYPQL
jgi:hypothetical protein